MSLSSPGTQASPAVFPVSDEAEWNDRLNHLGGHPLQLWGWGEVKSASSWTPHRIRVTSGSNTLGLAQVLVRQLPPPFRALSYVPRGPAVADEADEASRTLVAEAIVEWCHTHIGGIGITLEPDWPAQTRTDISKARPSPNPVLYPSTLILDLSWEAEKLLADMSKKTRQYIRKSSREDIEFRRVRSFEDIDQCLDIYHETAHRAGFPLHNDSYYRLVAKDLGENSPVFAAFAKNERTGAYSRVVAFLWLATSERTAFELYGGMNEEGRKLRANYGLKWYAISTLRVEGILRYDVNGLMNEGITKFKTGFSSHNNEMVGSLDVPFSPWYTAWNRTLPTAKKLIRRVRHQ